MRVREYRGADYGGEYTYYGIIGFDKCNMCEHFHDNEKEERFECDCENCEMRNQHN